MAELAESDKSKAIIDSQPGRGHSKKKLALVLLCLFLVIVVAVSVYFYLNHKNNKTTKAVDVKKTTAPKSDQAKPLPNKIQIYPVPPPDDPIKGPATSLPGTG